MGSKLKPDPRQADRDLDRYRIFWSSVDPAGLVITDDEAETTVAGCALASAGAAAGAVARLEGADFHDSRCWAAIVAAAALDPEPDTDAEWEQACATNDFGLVVHGCARRVARVAAVTGLEPALLASWVTGRTVERDGHGWFASRVSAAAEARRQVRALLSRAEELDIDLTPLHRVDPLPVVLDMVADAAAALGREVARGDLLGAGAAVQALIGVAEQLGVPAADAELWVAESYRAGGQGAGR